ncbi:hypothetical protein Patl1_36286 [Pistacia atlantica]|nr:hypothetical protein Patl1_36286 [Pistacia atlantica]
MSVSSPAFLLLSGPIRKRI